MDLEVEKFGEVDVIRVKEPRLTYPLLGTFSCHVSELIENGTRKLIVDLSETSDMDAASYGCLMDFYRMLSERGGTMKLAGLQDRVKTMARIAGITKVVDVFRDAESALKSFYPSFNDNVSKTRSHPKKTSP